MRIPMTAIAAIGLSAAALAPCAASAANLITNGSFEAPALTTGQYLYPGLSMPTTLDGWTYDGGGVVINATGYSDWYGATPPPGFDGAQFAGVQGGGSISQSFTVSASDLSHPLFLTFYDAGRPDFGAYAGNQTFRVLIDGARHGLFQTTSGQAFTAQAINLSYLSAGNHTIEFLGITTTDQTAFIDNVAIASAGVPEPAAWALLLAGFAGLGAALRRRRLEAVA